MKKKFTVLFLAAMSLALMGLSACSSAKAENQIDQAIEENNKSETKPEVSQPDHSDQNMSGEPITAFSQFDLPKEGEEIAIITTNMGEIKVRFFPNEAPKAVENFKTHAKNGYYNGIIFHRVIDNFMIQGGDPNANGTGGESIWGAPFEDEFSLNLRNFRGSLSMANAGANTNGSQFFINQSKTLNDSLLSQVKELKDEMGEEVIKQDPKTQEKITVNQLFSDAVVQKYKEVGGNLNLDYMHTVFGQVFEGLDVVDAIAATQTGADDKPVSDVVIEKVDIVAYTK